MNVRHSGSRAIVGTFLVSLLLTPFSAAFAAPVATSTKATVPLPPTNLPHLEPQSSIPYGSTVVPTSVLPSCFDYYTFGSVPVALTADLASVEAGTQFAVTANVENDNNYPLINTAVYIRVFREPASMAKNVNGPNVVDYFPIANNLTLKAHESKNITFAWNAPSDESTGSYEMVPFVVQDDRFNFLGLTFTDDITGGPYLFNVQSQTKGNVQIDRTTATLAGKPYHFAAYSPLLPTGTKDVPITLNVDNTTGAPYIGQLTWKLYSWDGTRPAALLDQKTQSITVSLASTSASYVVTDHSHSVYYVTAELSTKAGSHSIAAFRFVRPDVNEPRLASVEVNAYPLVPGSTAFACFHSSGSNKADNVQVNLSVETLPILGLFSIPIASHSYKGIAPGNLVAITVPIKGSYKSFQLVATLTQNGKQIDQVVVPYDCKVLTGCTDIVTPIIVGVSALILIGLIVLLFLLERRKKGPMDIMSPASRPL